MYKTKSMPNANLLITLKKLRAGIIVVTVIEVVFTSLAFCNYGLMRKTVLSSSTTACVSRSFFNLAFLITPKTSSG
jgi:hypothetical protein